MTAALSVAGAPAASRRDVTIALTNPNPTPRTAEFYKTRPCARMVMTAAGILDDYIAEHPVGTSAKPDMEQL